MKEWLLKEENKKVGRPKLANEKVLKKAKITICFSLFLCVIFSFCFASEITKENPFKLAYSVTLEKIFGEIENKNGFLVNYKYDEDYNYVLYFKVPDSVDCYSGSYKYTLYEMTKNEWKEVETKEIEKGTRDFKIVVKSLKNQNKTWKIKLQIINGTNIQNSYAPSGWSFVSSNKSIDMYAYKIFTVKGYYSPVTLNEIKEAKEHLEKITVSTSRKKPRSLNLNLPTDKKYDVKVTYTDSYSKKVTLANEKSITGKMVFNIPNINRTTNVTIKVYGDDLSNLKLSNWKLKKDENENSYITNTYLLKPEHTYNN